MGSQFRSLLNLLFLIFSFFLFPYHFNSYAQHAGSGANQAPAPYQGAFSTSLAPVVWPNFYFLVGVDRVFSPYYSKDVSLFSVTPSSRFFKLFRQSSWTATGSVNTAQSIPGPFPHNLVIFPPLALNEPILLSAYSNYSNGGDLQITSLETNSASRKVKTEAVTFPDRITGIGAFLFGHFSGLIESSVSVFTEKDWYIVDLKTTPRSRKATQFPADYAKLGKVLSSRTAGHNTRLILLGENGVLGTTVGFHGASQDWSYFFPKNDGYETKDLFCTNEHCVVLRVNVKASTSKVLVLNARTGICLDEKNVLSKIDEIFGVDFAPANAQDADGGIFLVGADNLYRINLKNQFISTEYAYRSAASNLPTSALSTIRTEDVKVFYSTWAEMMGKSIQERTSLDDYFKAKNGVSAAAAPLSVAVPSAPVVVPTAATVSVPASVPQKSVWWGARPMGTVIFKHPKDWYLDARSARDFYDAAIEADHKDRGLAQKSVVEEKRAYVLPKTNSPNFTIREFVRIQKLVSRFGLNIFLEPEFFRPEDLLVFGIDFDKKTKVYGADWRRLDEAFDIDGFFKKLEDLRSERKQHHCETKAEK